MRETGTVPPDIAEATTDLIATHGIAAKNYAAMRLEAAHQIGAGDEALHWLKIYRALCNIQTNPASPSASLA
ncbi:hypothetical protein [Acetobacter oeni]|uniref:Uncharacterized protein n=1 Tax=Acetobacter oeni TaxID=304077 RepID=A0A511XLX5_9PROT|nr:hypothetical protein [Acetobacter oeni]MBB3882925.1 hypothetical protein [Acetobacter oeni]NHO19007.1 hypothetical protein [Acetobacter oeni]GBR04834.1 hypothetical protein AA21952_1545 [Acetobacter oeni LMG 21952]GEN63953.1 hypothetical protein AOE01nite_21770 [Acetobacter oeni]